MHFPMGGCTLETSGAGATAIRIRGCEQLCYGRLRDSQTLVRYGRGIQIPLLLDRGVIAIR